MNLTEDNSGFIRKLFLRHVWPGVAAQVVSTAGPIACGSIAGVVFGGDGLAVMGLYSPFFFLAGFFGTIIASGSAAIAAKFIARDDSDRVAGIYTLALALTVALAAALCLALTLLRGPVLNLLAGGGELYEPASRYYTPTVRYTFFTVVVYMPISWSRLTGRPNIALILTLIMSGAGAALGAVTVFARGMGLESLADAQAIATALALVTALALLHLPKNRLVIKKPRHTREDTKAILVAGSPPGLSRLYRFASIFLLNLILLRCAGAGAVAVFGVLNMLLRFVTAFANGISGVQMPIAGVLREEHDSTSLKQLARAVFTYGNAVILAAAALMLLFRQALAALFGTGGEVFYFALACFCAYIPLYMNGCLFISWFTSIRRVARANIIAFAQDMLFPPLAALLLAGTGSRIWLHMPLAGVLTTALLIILARRRQESISGPALSFSVACDAEKASEASAAVAGFCEEQELEGRRAMLLAMAVEELIALIANHGVHAGKREDISVRLTFFDGGIVLRLRTGGKKFNPIQYYQNRLKDTDGLDDSIVDLLGVKFIAEAAEVVYYRETFGVNNLVVII